MRGENSSVSCWEGGSLLGAGSEVMEEGWVLTVGVLNGCGGGRRVPPGLGAGG